jgi:hypothetical protein
VFLVAREIRDARLELSEADDVAARRAAFALDERLERGG